MKNLLTILMFSIFIWGCNDDTPNNPNGGNTVLTLDLISPLNVTTDYCNIDFEWSISQPNISSVLEISTDYQFTNVVFTDTIADSTFTLMQNLQPNHQYYWRITVDTIVKIDSFTVQSVTDLADFVGTFPAMATYHHEAYPNDSVWMTTVQIDFNANDIPQMMEIGTNLTVNPEKFIGYFGCDIFYYQDQINWSNQPINTLYYSNNNGNLDIINRTFTFRKRIESNHFDIYIDYTGSID